MRKKPSEIKRLLVVIDLVNGFVREGTMADKYIEHIIPERNEQSTRARESRYMTLLYYY